MKRNFSFSLSSFFRYFLLSILLILVNLFLPLRFLKEASYTLTAPLSLGMTRFSKNIQGVATFGQNLRLIFDENQRLKEMLAEVKGLLVLEEKIKAENEFLKKELQVNREGEYAYLLADFRGWQEDNFGQRIIINKGEKDGLKVGMPLVSENNLIGVVVEVNQRNSVVEVITSPQSSIPAAVFKVNSTEKILGISEGEFGVRLQLKQIPQDAKINKGDLVVTSGKGGSLPQGLILGEITEVSQAQNEVYQQAKVSPLLSWEKLEKGLVILETQF
ncbi:rod shape-determining protein MreC [candidate division WWE3 bacterium CG06_land_8_20_14_3_00_42_16]|uniref:Cell shape-determining protein MreC n=4 Tax=Katanobacteria TaxID=422282 RepID=A0A2M7APM5_UNCKA|nr:MAG: rod shape-determining protein MreC [bacterium CG1_02_42_9]PIU69326.1 MAG: rod shape-determining protein MreC [candidate division WWE3 bacterium CG06_land_8_20_14_3_00_42_16]PIZ42850.1 MAG: rod shape-determining protein MreC [candidate division WWE3 bacterium CG_4_10_14_0_2_um_filter_42_8]PJA37328.1 MAG: rod shape-determining protein MreC [candidate division WWE3 bacterium CG_4_9_14_3_um_filter_43_9]PJC69076.1 MAG: rod shape-determining protein MreC [candidate division WWE3 bacterium CG_